MLKCPRVQLSRCQDAGGGDKAAAGDGAILRAWPADAERGDIQIQGSVVEIFFEGTSRQGNEGRPIYLS